MIIPVVCALVVTAAAASAQAPPALTSGSGDSTGAGAAAELQAKTPAPTVGLDESRSLFDQTWRQFQIGGRFTGVDGDPARFQRYQDLRSGVLFTDARYAKEDSGGTWLYRFTADNVGYRDQHYFGEYERTGKFHITGLWDEIPQFYSVDTKTPYTMSGSPLRIDDAAQLAAQNGGGLNVYLPIAQQFDLRERRDIGSFNMKATPTPNLDVTAAFTSTRHRGELPWGGSFGFSNDVEVALPYDSRTNDFTLGTEWTKGRNMLRVAYDGSWFNNLDPTLVWDSPLRVTDSPSNGPGSGQMQLWPSNSAQTISVAGYSKFAHRTQVTGFISFGSWSNDQPLLPFTINSALAQIPLPRTTAQADAHVFTTNLNLVSRPKTDWEFRAHAKVYDYNNNTPATVITQYVSYDNGVATSPTNGPLLYAHNRTSFDADATYTGVKPVALNVGYTRNNVGYDERIFGSTGENVLRLSADAVGTQWATFHAKYEYSSRVGSDLNENFLVQIGEQSDMRQYDLANRNRNQFTGIVDLVPDDRWTFSISGGVGADDYPDSYFGLQHATFQTFSTGVDFHEPNTGISVGGSYNFERYAGLQRSRSASSDPAQFNDPNRDWTTDSAETVNYFSIFVSPPKFGTKTEARLSYDFSYSEGRYLYTVVPGGPLPAPSQLPNVYNKLQQLHVDVRHRLSNRLVLAGSYLFEPFRVFDFAFDPSVVNSIVQPSSLVLGYVYRPYTANSFVISLRYYY
jgi:MtrB/PioB family decaheme-associated outer membrane protein